MKIISRLRTWILGPPKSYPPELVDDALVVQRISLSEGADEMFGPHRRYWHVPCGTLLTEGPEGGCAVNAVCRTCGINFGNLDGFVLQGNTKADFNNPPPMPELPIKRVNYPIYERDYSRS